MDKSVAAKLRLGTEEERKKKMKQLATNRWKNVSIEDRRLHALKMVNGRKLKILNKIK